MRGGRGIDATMLGLLASAGLSRVLAGSCGGRKARKVLPLGGDVDAAIGAAVREACAGVSTELISSDDRYRTMRVHAVELPGPRFLAVVVEVG